MGYDLSDDFDFDDHFKKLDHHIFEHDDRPWFGTMELIITVTSVIGIIIVLILLCKCCQRSKYRGQVINPPPPPGTVTTAPYPQQQYIATAVPVVQPYPTAFPAPYPHPVPPSLPAHAPPPPAAHAVQASAMPMPAAPYAGYPHPVPQIAPSAPDVNALPPSYEQATGADFKHSTPYNPGYN